MPSSLFWGWEVMLTRLKASTLLMIHDVRIVPIIRKYQHALNFYPQPADNINRVYVVKELA